MKALTTIVAVPAWLVIFYNILSGSPDDRIMRVAGVMFAAVCFLQIVFVVKAYWWHDI